MERWKNGEMEIYKYPIETINIQMNIQYPTRNNQYPSNYQIPSIKQQINAAVSHLPLA